MEVCGALSADRRLLSAREPPHCRPLVSPAMLQADDEDDTMDQQMKSPFGSSFRTFDATDYKPIGRIT